ncbi:MAG: ACT domain-containing protein [Pseudomonadota bacterium]
MRSSTGGESDLDTLLHDMSPALCPGSYRFCTAADGAIPPGVVPVMTFREAEGLSLIVEAGGGGGLEEHFPCAWITLSVHSALEAVGFLAAVTRHLAAAGISTNTVSAFHHDHLFVPEDKADEAMALLRSLATGHGSASES